MSLRFLLTFLCLFLGLRIFATGAEPISAVSGYEMSFPAMGSTFHISAYTNDEAKLVEVTKRIEQEVNRLNAVFTDYDSSSELQKLIASAKPHTVEISDDLFSIFRLSNEWYHKTSGSFDPSIGKVTHLWRKKRRLGRLPDKQEIAEALTHTGWKNIQVDEVNRRVSFLDTEIEIDLGGIATGYTVDKCFQMLIDAGIHCCLINSGGDIRCGQAPPERDGWKIEVAPIEKDQEPLMYLAVKNCAITTSGDLWRYIEVDGVRRSHIIDPQSGYGVPGPSAVTVISSSCLEVDVLGTTLSVLGPSAGYEFLQKNFPTADALFVWKPQGSERIEQKSTPNFKESGLR